MFDTQFQTDYGRCFKIRTPFLRFLCSNESTYKIPDMAKTELNQL